jgi:hypothetical protein
MNNIKNIINKFAIISGLAALLGVSLIPSSSMAITKVDAVNSKISCGVGKTSIVVRYSYNPTSYNTDFGYTRPFTHCVLNTVLNNSSSSATPSNWTKAMGALKLLADTSISAPAPNYFRPFHWQAATSCSASYTSRKFKMNITGSGSNITVKYCKQASYGGVGDVARELSTVKATLAPFYPGATITVLDRFGNLVQ